MAKIYGIIYRVTNKINGKMYIGQTVKSLNKRMLNHISNAVLNCDNMYFHRAIRKYGKENFKWEIIAECNSLEELNKTEIEMIKKYNTFNNGYNLTEGGEGVLGLCGKLAPWYGKHRSEETKKKLSKAHKGEKSYLYGKHLSEETKKKLSESHKGEKSYMRGKHHTEETRRKIGDANKGEKSCNYGKHHSEEN